MRRAISLPRSTAGPFSSPDAGSFTAWSGTVPRNATRSFPVGANAWRASDVGDVWLLAEPQKRKASSAVTSQLGARIESSLEVTNVQVPRHEIPTLESR